MSWVRIDDLMPDHPKVAPLSHAAFRLHVHGLCYAARALTDGFIPTAIADRLIHGAKRATAELVEYKVWDTTPGGYQIHDYGEYQQSKQHVLDVREKRAAAGRNGGLLSKPPSKTEANEEPKQEAESKPKRTTTPIPIPKGLTKGSPILEGQHQPQGGSAPMLTIKGWLENPVAGAAQQLLEQLPNATKRTVGRLDSMIARGASESDFHDARHFLKSNGKVSNPSAYACRIIDERMKARA